MFLPHCVSVKLMIFPWMPISSIAAMRKLPTITVVRVEVVIHMPAETLPSVEPGTRTDEYATPEPFRPIVAVRRTLIWWIVEVPIGTNWRRTDGHTDLGLRLRWGNGQ